MIFLAAMQGHVGLLVKKSNSRFWTRYSHYGVSHMVEFSKISSNLIPVHRNQLSYFDDGQVDKLVMAKSTNFQALSTAVHNFITATRIKGFYLGFYKQNDKSLRS